MRSIIP
jgi:uncharacterized membrane protein YsdA (DUF1294 family)